MHAFREFLSQLHQFLFGMSSREGYTSSTPRLMNFRYRSLLKGLKKVVRAAAIKEPPIPISTDHATD